MILVDSSVWIGYFRSGKNSNQLDQLIEMDLVCTNEIVLTELIPALQNRNHFQLIESLLSLPKIHHEIFWEGIRQLQILNISNGLNSVVLTDLIIVQNCLEANLELWTLDRHFYKMQDHLALKLWN